MKSDPTSESGSSGRERAAQVARSRQKAGCASDWSLAGRLAGDGGKMVDAHQRSKRPYASQRGKMQPLHQQQQQQQRSSVPIPAQIESEPTSSAQDQHLVDRLVRFCGWNATALVEVFVACLYDCRWRRAGFGRGAGLD